VHDAKRGELYFGARTREVALQEPVLLSTEEALARIAQLAKENGPALLLAGTAAGEVARALAQRGLSPDVSAIAQPDAVYVARLALAVPEPDNPPRPLYLRAPDAKLPAAS